MNGHIGLPRNEKAVRSLKIGARGHNAFQRSRVFARAREVRRWLVPIRTQAEVSASVGATRSRVEQIELEALAKIVAAFETERLDFLMTR